MKNIMAILILVAAASIDASPGERLAGPIQGGYSTLPLHEPLFDEAQVVVETTAINNWLNTNIQKLSYDQMKGPREHLYYLIDSRVKQIYGAERGVLPSKHDPILEVLFSWSEHLGVYGGAYAYNAVKAPSSPSKEAILRLPEGVELKLSGDVFTISSELGWSLTVPYYFMIWNVGDFVANGGPRTQLVVLSTGAAIDKSQAGRSQATLMFLFSPEESESFEGYWRGQLGIGSDASMEALGLDGLQSQHVIDEDLHLHKEFTSWRSPVGTVAVVYLGVAGTYEWNRPHFLDFLRTIKANKEIGVKKN